MEIKVLFGNLCQGLLYRGRDEHGADRFDGYAPKRYAESIALFQPDLMLCAEVLMDENGNSEMAGMLADHLNLSHILNHVGGPAWEEAVIGKHYGLSILSRYPLTDYEVVSLPNPNLEFRQPNGEVWQSHDKYVQKAAVNLPNGETVRCFNLHSYPFHRFGRSIADPEFSVWRDKLAETLLCNEGQKLIGAGDFNNKNVPIESILENAFATGRLKNAVPNTAQSVRLADESRAEDYRQKTIDYILCSQDFSVTDKAVLYGHSDHPMLLATLRIG